MKNLYVLYAGKPSYKRVLLRKSKMEWWHKGDLKFYFKPNWTSTRFWFWNIQMFIVGTSKCNGMIKIRLFNAEMEIGW